MHRTLLDEQFRIEGQEKSQESIEDIQHNLVTFLEFYNLKRSHQGYRLEGRTPAQALCEALDRKRLHLSLPKPTNRPQMRRPKPS